MSYVAYEKTPLVKTGTTGTMRTFNLIFKRGIYIPEFSNKWNEYVHDPSTLKTLVVSTKATPSTSTVDDGFYVYSDAQLQLLYQCAFALKYIKDLNSQKTTYKEESFQIEYPNAETLIRRLPSFEKVQASVLADLANISHYWEVEDSSCLIKPLCEVYQDGSYKPSEEGSYEYVLKDDLPIDVKLVRMAAEAYGMESAAISTVSSMKDIADWLVQRGLISQDYGMNNVKFPPITLTSPEYFQLPISAFNTGSSLLRGLNQITDKITINNVTMNLTNSSDGSTYNCKIMGGLFNSPTLDYVSMLSITDNIGAQGVNQILPKETFKVIAGKDKVIYTTTAGNQQFSMSPATSSFGYQAVVKVEFDYQNFFRNNQTSQLQHLTLQAFMLNIDVCVTANVAIPMLNLLNRTLDLNTQFTNIIFDQANEIAELKAQIKPQPGPGPDPPTPVPPEPTPGQEANLDNANTQLSNVTAVNGYGEYTTSGQHDRPLSTRLAERRFNKSKEAGKKVPEFELSLYNQIDEATLEVLSSQEIKPLQQFLSFGSLKDVEGQKKTFTYSIKGSLDVNVDSQDVPVASIVGDGPKVDHLQAFNVPLCAAGGNCYNKKGFCTRKKSAYSEAVIMKINQKGKIWMNSKMNVGMELGEMITTTPVQGNATNLTSIIDNTEVNETLNTAECVATDENPPDGYAEHPDGFIERDIQNKGKGIDWLGALKFGCNMLGKIGSAMDPQNENEGDDPNASKLVEFLAKQRFMASMSRLHPIQSLLHMRVRPSNGDLNDPETRKFVAGQISVDEKFEGLDGITQNTEAAWTGSDLFVIQQHPELLDFKYMLPRSENTSNVTPCFMTINKSAIINYGVGLAVANNTSATVPNGFRSMGGLTYDMFNNMVTSRCIVVLSTLPFGHEDYLSTAVICSGLNDFLKIPNPSSKTQTSAANGSSSGNFYGSFEYEGDQYYLFNNTYVTEINDLSGSLPYYIPSQIPVQVETDAGEKRIELQDTLEYYKNNGAIYSNIYCLTSFDVSVQLGNDLNESGIPEGGRNLALILWNMATDDANQQGLVQKYQMPYVTEIDDSFPLIKSCTRPNLKGGLPICQGLFYGVTDKFQFPNSGSRTTEAEAPLTKSMKSKSKSKSKPKKKTTPPKPLTGRAAAQMLSEKLPPGTKVTFLGSKK